MEVFEIVLICITALLLILYVVDKVRASVTTTREFFFEDAQSGIKQVTVIMKKNDVRELYLIDENDFCTKVNF